MSIKIKFLFISIFISSFFLANLYLKKAPSAAKPPLRLSSFLSKGDNNQTLKVEITFDEVKYNSDTAEVVAHVSLPFNFNSNLNYHWKFSDGVSLVQGELSGLIEKLNANEEKTISIKVTGFSKQSNHQIKFEVAGAVGGHYLNGESLVSSDLDNTFENTVQNVERIKASE